MTNFIIQKKSPNSNWVTIHRNYDLAVSKSFLEQMGAGGYDGSATDGAYYPDTLEARFYDGGDLIEFRALEV